MHVKPAHIQGKWNRHMYEVQRELGRGANGVVYLVHHHGQSYALKVGEDSFSMTSEVNVLRQLQKAQGQILGPSVYDVDDWPEGNVIRPFYVMNVMEGMSLPDFVRKRGQEWIPVFILHLLNFLADLHGKGWIFGDLKPDNLLVSGHPPQVAWFDAGGITKRGRAVKEYTEVYDRGFWNLGNRKAEPSYDLFSLAMITLTLYQGEPATSGTNTHHYLYRKVFDDPRLAPYHSVLWKALKGQYALAKEMKYDWVKCWHRTRVSERNKHRSSASAVPATPSKQKQSSPPRKKGLGLGKVVSVFFLSSFILFLFAVLLWTQSIL